MARVAIPLAQGFEDCEFDVPRRHLRDAGHQVVVLGLEAGDEVRGKRGEVTARVDTTAGKVDPGEFDALVIPGGHAPDRLRLDAELVEFVERFWHTGRLVAAICHGPQLLIEADVLDGRTITSWPSVRTDLENAGAIWVDGPVVEDENLVTSRGPRDLERFCTAILERLHDGEVTSRRTRGGGCTASSG